MDEKRNLLSISDLSVLVRPYEIGLSRYFCLVIFLASEAEFALSGAKPRCVKNNELYLHDTQSEI